MLRESLHVHGGKLASGRHIMPNSNSIILLNEVGPVTHLEDVSAITGKVESLQLRIRSPMATQGSWPRGHM